MSLVNKGGGACRPVSRDEQDDPDGHRLRRGSHAPNVGLDQGKYPPQTRRPISELVDRFDWLDEETRDQVERIDNSQTLHRFYIF